eukprot:Skav232824  [mRNA]  locus=scaffold614:720879:721307:- [translate_table: standard]
MARHGKAWQGMARHGKAWQGMARHGKAWQGMARHGKAWQGMARHGKAWQGMARHGKSSRSLDGLVFDLPGWWFSGASTCNRAERVRFGKATGSKDYQRMCRELLAPNLMRSRKIAATDESYGFSDEDSRVTKEMVGDLLMVC